MRNLKKKNRIDTLREYRKWRHSKFCSNKKRRTKKGKPTDKKITDHKEKITTNIQGISPTISIISLNFNDLTIPIKKQALSEWIL